MCIIIVAGCDFNLALGYRILQSLMRLPYLPHRNKQTISTLGPAHWAVTILLVPFGSPSPTKGIHWTSVSSLPYK
jgi:hypothetical protein